MQAKFSRDPDSVRNPAAWLDGILSKEKARIARLASRGVRSYRLMTNMRGTATLDRGSIDRIDALLRELPFDDVQCLWRDDLDVLMIKHRALKWEFRELLASDDILEELVFSTFSEDVQRRALALRAFLSAQTYEDDTVRFREAELQSSLFDLWIDVPVLGITEAPNGPGAAAVLLSNLYDTVFLHGAPGQGKSTLTQYLCQVHRVRLLQTPERGRLGGNAETPLRLPVRAELPQLATYLQGHDPFHSDRSLPGDASPTLEGFLAHLISARSGGGRFDVPDLRAVLAAGPVLIALDGLDEVPALVDRQRVVDSIEEGRKRLRSLTDKLQIVVTSRPRAFTYSPAFGREWETLELADLPKPLIMEYAHVWHRARSASAEEEQETTELLTSRLDDPTFADLVRNPMQLAIVLSLLQRKGHSLPDRRSELYREYMQHYLDRDARKSRVVRENRAQLYNLHGVIAFKMHAQAEVGAAKGTIQEAELRSIIGTFFADRPGGEAVLQELLQGVVERFMALVSREVGSFEFEVQPLREFFAAHFLYDTAPAQGTGSIVDRFDALARNPYWLNVLRFFAGNYGTGQVASLVDGIAALQDDPDWGPTDHPRLLLTMLLRDKVFALDPRAYARAAGLLLDNLPARHVLTYGPPGNGEVEGLTVPERDAADRIVSASLAALSGHIGADRASAIASVLRNYRTSADVDARFRSRLDSVGPSGRAWWLELACHAGVIETMAESEISTALKRVRVSPTLAMRLMENAPQYVESSVRLSQLVVEATLAHGEVVRRQPDAGGTLYEFCVAVTPVFHEAEDAITVKNVHVAHAPRATLADGAHGNWLIRRLHQIAEKSDAGDMMETIRTAITGQYEEVDLAVLVADNVTPAVGPPAHSLVDRREHLLHRLSSSRLHEGAPDSWWARQIALCKDEQGARLVAFCMLRWDYGKNLRTHIEWVNRVLEGVDDRVLRTFARGVVGTYPFSGEVHDVLGAEWHRLSTRTLLVLAGRLDGARVAERIRAPARELDSLGQSSARILGDRLVTAVIGDEKPPEWVFAAIQDIYRRDRGWIARPNGSAENISLLTGKKVLREPEGYPLALVLAAEAAADAHARAFRVRDVATLAAEGRWFAP
jgi:hypothetical protein